MNHLGMLLQLAGMAFMPVALVAGLSMNKGFILEIALGVTGILSFLLGRYLENRFNRNRIDARKAAKASRKAAKKSSDPAP